MPRLKLPHPPRRNFTLPKPDIASSQMAEEEDGHGARMGLFEHLDELRLRLTRAGIALVVGTLIGLALSGVALDYLRGPYCRIVAENAARAAESAGADLANVVVPDNECKLVTLGPTGGVVAYFRVGLMIGGIIAIPMITYQLLMFIFPGLTRKEKRVVLMALPAIFTLFLVGTAFSWFILMPPALGFLEGFQPNLFRSEWTADLYLSFITALIFWMGVAFQTPLVFFVLGLLGLVTTGALIRNWRLAVVGAAVAAALITPTIDPVNMFLVMGPLLVLYALSVILVFAARRIARLDAPQPYETSRA
ncbi:MAG: twin-arginine translocase subunit TatC [Aggregatilineales bacterium]